MESEFISGESKNASMMKHSSKIDRGSCYTLHTLKHPNIDTQTLTHTNTPTHPFIYNHYKIYIMHAQTHLTIIHRKHKHTLTLSHTLTNTNTHKLTLTNTLTHAHFHVCILIILYCSVTFSYRTSTDSLSC